MNEPIRYLRPLAWARGVRTRTRTIVRLLQPLAYGALNAAVVSELSFPRSCAGRAAQGRDRAPGCRFALVLLGDQPARRRLLAASTRQGHRRGRCVRAADRRARTRR